MKIRKAKEVDLKKIDKIYLKGVIDEIKLQFPNRSRLSIIQEMTNTRRKRLSGWKKELKSDKSFWIIAEENGNFLGFANAEIKDKNQGWLTMLYVNKEFRRKGIGKILTKERINWLRKNKAKEIYAGMLAKNKNSISNLEKFGFKITSVKMFKRLK